MTKKITMASLAALLVLFTIAVWGQDRDNDRDEQARVTNGPNVQWVGGDRAQVAWSTNVNSGQIVRYGTDPNRLDQTKESKWGGQREKNGDYLHKEELTGLKPGTTYYFQIESTKAAESGQNVIGKVQSFQTKGGGAGAAAANESRKEPVRISNGPVVKKTTPSVAEIAWSTNVPGSSIVKYGTDRDDLNQTAEAPWGGSREANGDYNHTVWVKNLKPNTTYYFVVETTQAAGTGTQAQSQPQQFRTQGASAKK